MRLTIMDIVALIVAMLLIGVTCYLIFYVDNKQRFSGAAILISVFSLLFSGATFYVQDIRKNSNVKASVISIWPYSGEGTHCVADIVFVNNGNRACSIIDVKFQWCNKAEISKFKGLWVAEFSDQSPFTIKPNEVFSKRFNMSTKGQLDSDRRANVGDRMEYALCFELVDSDGKLHRVIEPFFFRNAGEKEDAFNGIGLLPRTVILLPSPIDKTGLGVMTP